MIYIRKIRPRFQLVVIISKITLTMKKPIRNNKLIKYYFFNNSKNIISTAGSFKEN